MTAPWAAATRRGTKIRLALERGGIEFIDENGGGPRSPATKATEEIETLSTAFRDAVTGATRCRLVLATWGRGFLRDSQIIMARYSAAFADVGFTAQ